MRTLLFEQVTIIGLGLIGSSIARGVREYRVSSHIVGCDANDATLAYARSSGIINAASLDAGIAVKGSDLVIIATPPSALGDTAKAIASHLSKGAIVMDVASVKQAAIAAIAPALPAHVSYIPAHPIAGSEKSGVKAGTADLFINKRVIVTPAEITENAALQRVTSFWTALGARVEGIPADLHDKIYACVSHLPQLLAFAAGQSIPADGKQSEMLVGFMRLSRSAPELWMDIFALNKANLLTALDRYLDAATHIQKELETGSTEPPGAHDEWLASHVLFPRIAASCLVTTVMEAERNAGFSFARYTGTGFASFTAALSQPPEEDIEGISGNFQAVAKVLHAYTSTLKSWREWIIAGNFDTLQAALRQ